LRLPFAFSGDFERYRDVTPTARFPFLDFIDSLTSEHIEHIIPAPPGPRNDSAETFGPSEVEGGPNEISEIDVCFCDDRLRSVSHANWVSSAATAREPATATSFNRH